MARALRYHVVEQISPHLSETPEGFLVCSDVGITRTGSLLYRSDEVPLESDASGIVQIDRIAEDVFDPETMASFEGKPVTINHPDDMVTPDTWKELAVGTVQNVRRGGDGSEDLMLADLLITDATAINLVKAGLREVSCGYDAEYEQTAPGRGRQTRIIGNHVALVTKGRAGSRCAIMDSNENKEDQGMKTLKDIVSAFKAKFKDADEEEKKEAEEEMKDCFGKKTKDEENEERFKKVEETVDSIRKSVDALSKKFKDAEEETEEEKKKREEEEEAKKKEEDGKTSDAAFRDCASRAEILIPGYKVPTFDAKDSGKLIDGVKRSVLADLYKTEDGKKLVEAFTGPVKDMASLPQATVDAAFLGASVLMSQANNEGVIKGRIATGDFGKPVTAASINKRNAEVWANRK